MRSWRRWLATAILLAGTAAILPQLQANPDSPAAPPTLQQLRGDAERLQRERHWADAASAWGKILSKDRDFPGAREQYQFCVRREQQARRQRDETYLKQVELLDLREALRVYEEVVLQLHTMYVDRDRADFALLFKHGLEEVRAALDDPLFRQERLPGVSPEAVRAFQTRLQAGWTDRPIRNAAEARALARSVGQAAKKDLGLEPTLVVLEMLCGACTALDEYTAYLTPAQITEMDTAWKGEVIGLGIEVVVNGQKQLLIVQVFPGSPAEAAGLKPNDYIKRIGNRPAAGLAAEVAAELLNKGDVGSLVEVEVATGSKSPRVLKLKRQVIRVPSVSEPRLLEDGIGYVQVSGFQTTTVPDLDEAINRLQMRGMKVLILDLRGNQGGLVDVAIEVVERFVPSGLIVSTHGQVREYNARFEAHGMNPVPVPVVVLVDGETASAAEIVAAALKDHQRGKLVGTTTFGKGCIQKVQRLKAMQSAGIRLTVAKFYSPHGQPISGTGVTPDVTVKPMDLSMDPEQDTLQTGLELARSLLMSQ
jgi:carboxyl-terminal processing protease